ncbi:orotate phosphoribosyltransferase [Candidatus Poribacteria bacterium]|nr:orotate phosphoribosyltransferase [Candidatus Poribacteria bacterium]
MSITYREKLLSLLCELSYREGEFILSSGKKSSYYIDGKMTSLHSEGSFLIAYLFLEKMKELNLKIDAVGGPTMGADPIVGAMLALGFKENSLPPFTGFLIRKEAKAYGRKKLIEGPWKNGNKVIIIEDVITTGGSTYKAIEAAEEAEGKTEYVFSIIDREEGGRAFLEEKGYKLYSIFTLGELKSNYTRYCQK